MRSQGFIITFSTTLALLVMGLFLSLLLASGNMSAYVKSHIKLQVYIQRGYSSAQLALLKDSLQSGFGEACPMLHPSFKLITKEQAANTFIKESGEDFVSFLGDNPLRDYFEVSLPAEELLTANLECLKTYAQKQHTVFEVTYLKDIADSLLHTSTILGVTFGAFSLLLMAASIALVSNTVRLSLYARRFMLRSMQLVGAAPWFIQRPFTMRALRVGLYSGILASGIILALYQALAYSLPDASQFLTYPQLGLISLLLILTGMGVGALSSYVTVRGYLLRPLDKIAL